MKLSQAIEFATTHNVFTSFVNSHKINLESARELRAKMVKNDDRAVWVEIYIDYGTQGIGINDIRIRIRFDKNTQKFVFDDIDRHS